VTASAGSSQVRALLVANRGEIARRVFRTARAMGIRCLAVYTDADAAAPHVSDADEAIRLRTGYLDGPAIIDAAIAARADSIHPGYGFLSENAGFARAVQAAGLTWVGPSPAAIEALGDKLRAKETAMAAGVPTLPSGGEAGFPVLVKAAAGGGGKGMRVVATADELDDAIAAAQREAANAFGDPTVFLERYVARSRHVEVQILGDAHGGLVHLGDRECSIQRRHQKIVEEAPSPVTDLAMRTAMGAAALRLAAAIGYTSAGTVEFIVDDVTREFFFLEANARLQVEHPVTEEVTGIDIVREQLRIASGEPLGYGQDDITFTGHAIEVRLYAEDPATGFLPETGTVAAFEPTDQPRVRWESGVARGSVVTIDFDPMLAKVVSHAPTRTEAAGRLSLALERLHLGGVRTNRDFLVETLRHPGFLAGDTTTDFVERLRPALAVQLDEDLLRRVGTAAALWLQGANRAAAPVLREVPSGWRNARLPAERVTFTVGDRAVDVQYVSRANGTFDTGDGAATVHRWTPDSIDVEIDGHRARYRTTRFGDRLLVQTPRGTTELHIKPRFAVPNRNGPDGGFVAPMPGAVIEVRCKPGDRVAAGDTLVLLEAMKMEHHVKAPKDGRISEVRVAAGQQVKRGDVLLLMDQDPA
jgi:propionyl-CoA carboxylase alpha chain